MVHGFQPWLPSVPEATGHTSGGIRGAQQRLPRSGVALLAGLREKTLGS